MKTQLKKKYEETNFNLPFRWKSRYEVGIPSIDSAHKQLVEYYNELCRCNDRHECNAMLEYFLDRFIGYAEKHFAHEENLMRHSHFPGTEEHIEQHRQFRHRMKSLFKKYAEGNESLGPVLSRYLRKWITKHILVGDREFCTFMFDKHLEGPHSHKTEYKLYKSIMGRAAWN